MYIYIICTTACVWSLGQRWFMAMAPYHIDYIKLTVCVCVCVCSLTPPKLLQWTPPSLHRLWRTVWKVSSTGQRRLSYHCSGGLLPLLVLSFGSPPYFPIIASSCWLPRNIETQRFTKALLPACRSIEACQRRASMLVLYIIHKQ